MPDNKRITELDELTSPPENAYLPIARDGAPETEKVKVSNLVPRKWLDYATGFSVEPLLLSTIAAGDVYEYKYGELPTQLTLYRLVPSGSADDAFYTTYASGALSGLVAKKEIII